MPRAITNLGTLATKYTLKFSGLGYVNSGYLWEYQFLITTLLNVPGTFTPFYLVPKKKIHQKSLFFGTPQILRFTVSVVFESPSHIRLFATSWTAVCQASLTLTVSKSLPKFMSSASMMPSSHLILSCPLLLRSVFPSIMVFSSESVVHII